MARLDTDRQEKLEPKRMEYAIKAIQRLGYEITYQDSTKIKFEFNGKPVTLFPFSGWHTGKTIKDGRGINHLLKQLST
jgi:hypothetical protein